MIVPGGTVMVWPEAASVSTKRPTTTVGVAAGLAAGPPDTVAAGVQLGGGVPITHAGAIHTRAAPAKHAMQRVTRLLGSTATWMQRTRNTSSNGV
jgi:hypothetical protein